MRRLVVVALVLGVAMLASPALAQGNNPGTPVLKWTIKKLVIVNRTPTLIARGACGEVKQYVKYQCKKYEVPSKTDPKNRHTIDEVHCIKFHFGHEEAYELHDHVLYGRTLGEAVQAVVDELENATPRDKVVNIVADFCNRAKSEKEVDEREYFYTRETGDCAVKEEHLTNGHWLSPELEALVIARLGVISDGKLSIRRASRSDQYDPLPETCGYAAVEVVEKETGKRHHLVILRSDNNPTAQWLP